MQYKRKHHLSAALMAGAMCCTMIPAVSAGEIIAPETAQTATLDPDAAVLYADLVVGGDLVAPHPLPHRRGGFVRRPAGCTCRILHRQRGASGCDRADKNRSVAVDGRSVGAGQPP